MGYSNKVKRILKKYGDSPIEMITIDRTPLSAFNKLLLNVASLGEFEKRVGRSQYDKLFHLRMDIKTQKGRVSLEKNERINMDEKPKKQPKAERTDIPIRGRELTINQLLENTKKAMGKNYFPYDPYQNNCQNFILEVMKSNGIGNQSQRDFVKQDTTFVFKNSPNFRKIARTLTAVGGEVSKTVDAVERTAKQATQEVAKAVSHPLMEVKKKAPKLGRQIVSSVKQTGKAIESLFKPKKKKAPPAPPTIQAPDPNVKPEEEQQQFV